MVQLPPSPDDFVIEHMIYDKVGPTGDEGKLKHTIRHTARNRSLCVLCKELKQLFGLAET